MKNLTKLAKRMREAREACSLSREKLASKVDLKKQTIYYYENSLREPSYDILSRIAEACNVTISYLLGETDESKPPQSQAPPPEPEPEKPDIEALLSKFAVELHDEFDIPVYSGVRASQQGTPLYEDHIDTIRVNKRWKNCIALRVQGESMLEAFIMPGDDVIVCKELEPQNGHTVVVYNGEQEYLIKKLWRIRGKLYLGATKQDCFPIGNFHVLGRVVEIRRKV